MHPVSGDMQATLLEFWRTDPSEGDGNVSDVGHLRLAHICESRRMSIKEEQLVLSGKTHILREHTRKQNILLGLQCQFMSRKKSFSLSLSTKEPWAWWFPSRPGPGGRIALRYCCGGRSEPCGRPAPRSSVPDTAWLDHPCSSASEPENITDHHTDPPHAD